MYFDKIAEMRAHLLKENSREGSNNSFFGRVKSVHGLTSTIETPDGDMEVITSAGTYTGGTRIRVNTAQGDVDLPF